MHSRRPPEFLDMHPVTLPRRQSFYLPALPSQVLRELILMAWSPGPRSSRGSSMEAAGVPGGDRGGSESASQNENASLTQSVESSSKFGGMHSEAPGPNSL